MKVWQSPYYRAVFDYRRALVVEALLAEGGNRSAAARRLGVDRRYLTRLIRAFGITIPSPSDALVEVV